jgi:carboxypeptidase C (cathepsin A)
MQKEGIINYIDTNKFFSSDAFKELCAYKNGDMLEYFNWSTYEDILNDEELTIEDIVNYIWDHHTYSEEDFNSNYIYTTSTIKTKQYKFSITGQQYRNSQYLGDMEMDYITIKVEDLDIIYHNKLMQISTNQLLWKKFINEHSKEEIFEKVKNIEF